MDLPIMPLRSSSLPFGLALAAALVAAPLRAQSSAPKPAKLLGQVREAGSRRPISGAEIQIVSGPGTLSDARGLFRLDSIAPGPQRLIVRRVGYAPLDTVWSFAAGDSLVRIIELNTVQNLDSVLTVGNAERDPRMREFEEHRKLGMGTFYTRADIEKAGGQISNLMSATNGVRLTIGPANQAYVLSSMGMKSIAELMGLEPPCYAEVYLDDANVYSRRMSKTAAPPFDINSISPASIEAIEYYSGVSQMPAKYQKLDTHCGVVVIHTRRPTPRRAADSSSLLDAAMRKHRRGAYVRAAAGSAFLTTGSGRTMSVEAGVASAGRLAAGIETMSFRRSTEESGRWTVGLVRLQFDPNVEREVGWWVAAGVGKGAASTVSGFGPNAYVAYQGSGLGLLGEFGLELQAVKHIFITPAVAAHRAGGDMMEQGCSQTNVSGPWTCSAWLPSDRRPLQAVGVSLGLTIR
jgi:hypothetical protein